MIKISFETLRLLDILGDVPAKQVINLILNSSISYTDIEHLTIEYNGKYNQFVLTF